MMLLFDEVFYPDDENKKPVEITSLNEEKKILSLIYKFGLDSQICCFLMSNKLKNSNQKIMLWCVMSSELMNLLKLILKSNLYSERREK